MDLKKRLQEETKSLHNNIEQTFLLKQILLKQISLSDYKLLIKKFYGFITPCETLIDSLPCNALLKNREKQHWLKEDLLALKIPNNDNAEICMHLPVLYESQQVLGYLYVMEGSTLGGQVITKMINSQLQITKDQGGRFFYGYGDQTKIMWNDFCAHLSRINNLDEQNIIIHSAIDTYNRLSEWMESRT